MGKEKKSALKKRDLKAQSKQVSFPEKVEELEKTLAVKRTWNDFKKRKCVTGQLTDSEMKLLVQAMCDYA
jgi:hypothetical protein